MEPTNSLGHCLAVLLSVRLERIRQNACKFVRAHALEHEQGSESIDALLDGLAVVLAHVDGTGLLLVNGLSNRAQHGRTLRVAFSCLSSSNLPRPSPLSEASHRPRGIRLAQPPGRRRCRHTKSLSCSRPSASSHWCARSAAIIRREPAALQP